MNSSHLTSLTVAQTAAGDHKAIKWQATSAIRSEHSPSITPSGLLRAIRMAHKNPLHKGQQSVDIAFTLQLQAFVLKQQQNGFLRHRKPLVPGVCPSASESVDLRPENLVNDISQQVAQL